MLKGNKRNDQKQRGKSTKLACGWDLLFQFCNLQENKKMLGLFGGLPSGQAPM